MKLLEDYKQWKLDHPDEGYQYDMIDDFFTEYGRGDLQSLLDFAEKAKIKADKWDELDKEIGEFYSEEEGGEGSLLDIGEISAIAFGYL